jgi:4-diphosphocytidyl-2-C-methyl-D-erythritol kinase
VEESPAAARTQAMTRAMTLRPSAKINWSLVVGPRQSDGYHDVRTILQTIDLSDTLAIRFKRGPFTFQLTPALKARGSVLSVPADDSNLVCRAARALWTAAGRSGEPRDAHVKLAKAIPVGAGLGGGSADAAAALVGLNAVWQLKIARHELVRLAASLGADVPFFLTGGTAMGLGRGDEIYPLTDIRRFGIVLIKPSFGVSTSDAYGWLEADRETARVACACAEINVGWPSGPLRIINDLQTPVSRRHPAIQDAIEACYRQGAVAAAMTGSGSAVFGVFSMDQRRRAARRLQRPDWQVFASRTLSRAEAGRRMTL